MKKLLILLVVVGAGVGLWYWNAMRAAAAAAETPPPTVAVARGDLAQTVLASGTIQSEALVTVIARQSGQIETLDVVLGQTVKSGDVLARLDASDQTSAVRHAEADIGQLAAQLEARRAALTQAEQTLERARELADRQLGSQGELEAAQAALAVAQADIAALEAQRAGAEVTLADAQLALERTQIRAPMDGTVITIIASEGQMVASGQDSATILKIADMTKMVAKVEISEADVIRVQPGQKARLTLLGDPTSGIDATVRLVEPASTALAESGGATSSDAVYYNALLDVANPEGKLRIGMTVQATITLDSRTDVLILVASAIETTREGSRVAIWNPGTRQTEDRKVDVGLTNNISAEILSGLAEGDLVVTDRAAEGAKSAAVSMRRPPGAGF